MKRRSVERSGARRGQRRRFLREMVNQQATRTGNAGLSLEPPVDDTLFMELALGQARAAARAGEIPIGAVVVVDGVAVASAHNLTRRRKDPRAHAEMLALDGALERFPDLRHRAATVFTTVEPCFMCAGALSQMRVTRVVWGVRDEKFGGCASLGQVLSDRRLNHRAEIVEGVCADAARDLLQEFFRKRRSHA